jgi:hypothetical protein
MYRRGVSEASLHVYSQCRSHSLIDYVVSMRPDAVLHRAKLGVKPILMAVLGSVTALATYYISENSSAEGLSS